MPEAQNVYTSAPDIYNQSFLFAQKIRQKYKTEYKKEISHHAVAAYDLLQVIKGLFEDKEFSKVNVRQELEKGFIHSGIFGMINVKPESQDILFPLSPAQIKNNQINYQ